MNKEQVKELAEINATYMFDKVTKLYGEYTDEYVRHFYNKLAELRSGIDDNHTCNCRRNSNSRDNEPCCRCDSKVSENDDTKNKVTSLKIIVRMIDNKPYYEIKYKKVDEDYYHVGYSSYNLDNVLKWRNECFELVENDREERSEKLKSCPFCGGKAEIIIFSDECGTVTVGCTNEECDITMGKAFFTDEEAIQHWNRRVNNETD